MTATLIDGKALANAYREQLARRVDAVRQQGREVRLDAVLVGAGDNAARQYAVNQGKTCEKVGITYKLHELPATADFDDIAGRVLVLNNQENVTAIMVHMPLPDHADPYSIQRLIAPEKDVEGVNPANIGNIVYGRSSLAPCTALATIKMVQSVLGNPQPNSGGGNGGEGGVLAGKHAVVVGASNVVGKPIAVLLMRQDATVTSCNVWTPDLARITREADVLVAAAGVPGLITADMVKPGAIVLDVGVNRVQQPDGSTKTVGDVEFDAVNSVASHISPVPGGVGPMTVAMLLLNVVKAAELARPPAPAGNG